jgi:hypothetical protein
MQLANQILAGVCLPLPLPPPSPPPLPSSRLPPKERAKQIGEETEKQGKGGGRGKEGESDGGRGWEREAIVREGERERGTGKGRKGEVTKGSDGICRLVMEGGREREREKIISERTLFYIFEYFIFFKGEVNGI